jgi:hypothetical protein
MFRKVFRCVTRTFIAILTELLKFSTEYFLNVKRYMGNIKILLASHSIE